MFGVVEDLHQSTRLGSTVGASCSRRPVGSHSHGEGSRAEKPYPEAVVRPDDMTTTLTVEGMGCEGCEDIVENALSDVDDVEDASADEEAGTATVEGDADAEALREALEYAGYDADVAE